MNSQILQHFQTVDPTLYGAIKNPEKITVIASDTLFSDLCENVVSQQLSSKAAETIWLRFTSLFPGEIVTPERIEVVSLQDIRSVGISESKAQYLKNIATAVLKQGLNLHELHTKSDEDVITALTVIKGIGMWTSEMFLMFSLGREDIFSFGDMGLKRAIQKIYTLKQEPSLRYLQGLSQSWKPYRTYACRILWQSLES